MNKDNEIKLSDFKLGEITDGDEFERPVGSFNKILNVDFEIDKGRIRTRNNTGDYSTYYTLPTFKDNEYIINDGVIIFSLNHDKLTTRSLVLIATQENDGGGNIYTRFYINQFYNPPADLLVTGFGTYENYTKSEDADAWHEQWIELTEKISLGTITNLINGTNFEVAENSLLHQSADRYRGWFIWNKTLSDSNTSNEIQNKSFVCIEANTAHDPSNPTIRKFTIQDRTGLNLTDLAWTYNQQLYLVRYPVTIHKRNDWSSITRIKFVKFPSGIKILIGQEGNLELRFLNKDITSVPSTTSTNYLNKHKYYGLWLDYDIPPVDCLMASLDLTSDKSQYIDPKIGVKLRWSRAISGTDVYKLGSMTVKYDGYQYICLSKIRDNTAPTNNYLRCYILNYHHYSRRIYGAEGYQADSIDLTKDCTSIRTTVNEPLLVGANYEYTPSYSLFYNLDILATGNNQVGQSLFSRIQYIPEEKIYNKTIDAVYTQSRIFEIGDNDNADAVQYSLFNKDSIVPLQNKQQIDAKDKDRNVAIEMLGVNPCIFKNNSVHIINIEGQQEVGWRLIDVAYKIGTSYPRAITVTPHGIVFCNNDSIWLLRLNGQIVNLLLGRKELWYKALTTKSSLVAKWYPYKEEVWIQLNAYQPLSYPYTDYLIINLNNNSEYVTVKNYKFNYAYKDMIIDEYNRLILIGNQVYHYILQDTETQTGKDLGYIEINYDAETNYIGNRNKPFHHIETMVNFKSVPRAGEFFEDFFHIKIFKEGNVELIDKAVTFGVAENKESKNFRNPNSDRQRAIKYKITGILEYMQRLYITEITSRIKEVKTQVKAGYQEVV